MEPEPKYSAPLYKGSGKLKGKVAIITGGDSGIGRSVSVLYGREGANVAIIYHKNHEDAEKTKKEVEKEGAKCILIPGDVTSKKFCEEAVKKCVDTFGKLDILVNHAGVQWSTDNFLDITEEQLDKTMKTNVYSYFFMAQAALPHLKEGSCIINTSSVNAYKGNEHLMDYSTTKGANRVFTYSLASNLVSKGIRVNAVAPGPIWTPFIPGSFPAEKVKDFGKSAPMGRAGQPEEVAPAYVFLASPADSSYITGQTIHVNGGMITSS
jgi:NAD(P)-dependent dehydrogenase (short-subunit alcohol dehydrogenase family)